MHPKIIQQLKESEKKLDEMVISGSFNYETKEGYWLNKKKIKDFLTKSHLSLLRVVAKSLEEKEVKWDNPPREIQDTDYKLGKILGYNQCLQELKKLLT